MNKQVGRNSNFLQKWLNDIPISRKLYFTVVIMSVLIAVQLGAIWFAIYNLSAVRAYISGETYWSMAQKNAIYYLREFELTKDTANLSLFDENIEIMLGDRMALTEIDSKNTDLKIVRKGISIGRSHPKDVDKIVFLATNFRHFYYIEKIVITWKSTDLDVDELIRLRTQLESYVRLQKPSTTETKELIDRLDQINRNLTEKSVEFSATLAEGARWLESLTFWLLIALTLFVELTGILITVLVSRGLEKGINRVLRAAKRVTAGNLNTEVMIVSKDELGELAHQFNHSTLTIKNKINELNFAEENLREEKHRAENSMKLKQIFLTNMSHEIRTPMNAIIGFSRLLENTPLTKDQKETIQAISLSSTHLMDLLNGLLNISETDANTYSFSNVTFNLKAVIEHVLQMISNIEKSKNLDFSFLHEPDIPELLSGDTVKLSQILINLLNNAVKFTQSGKITIQTVLQKLEENKATVQFSISDTGIGISKEKLPFVFDNYTQAATDTNRLFGGTGLGLSIVQNLIVSQGGTISVSSELGKGTIFTFELTYAISEDLAKETTVDKNSLSTPYNIHVLVAEDNRTNQILIKKVLQKQGFKVTITENGQEAIETLLSGNYQLVIMDLQMPIMDGYEATIAIRELEHTYKKIPILAMTAHALTDEMDKCFALGMNGFFTKPFNPAELKSKILELAG